MLPLWELLAIGLVLSAATVGSRVLSSTPLVAIGKVSYGLYLWHVPIADRVGKLGALTLPQTLITLALSALATVASYRLIEMPVRGMRHVPQKT
jgi:peptidoglycan/LPS O-acetylase OafA/YrhL